MSDTEKPAEPDAPADALKPDDLDQVSGGNFAAGHAPELAHPGTQAGWIEIDSFSFGESRP